MPSSPIQILDYSAGVQPDQTTPIGFSSMVLLDPYSEPGILRINNKPTALTGTTTGDPTAFEIYDDGAAAVYVYTDDSELYEIVSTTLTSRRSIAGGNAGHCLKAFQTSLYYTWYSLGTNSGRLGKLTGDSTVAGNYSDSFKTLVSMDDNGEFYPMEVFAGALYIANGRYVSKLESDETTFTSQALTVAKGLVIQAMIVWEDFLVLSTVSKDATADEYIMFWDGISDFPDQIIKVPKPGASALANKNNVLLAFIGEQVYYYTGSEFEVAFAFPKIRDDLTVGADPFKVNPGAVDLFKERLMIGTSETFGYALTGVWCLGKHSEPYADALTFAHVSDSSQANYLSPLVDWVTALKTIKSSASEPTAGTLYFGCDGGTVYKVNDDSDLYTTGAYFVTEIYEVADVYGRLMKGVRPQFASAVTGINNSVTIKYRADNDISLVDDTANWTTLGTVTHTNTSEEQILYGIYKRVRRIQFRVEFTTDNNTFDSLLAGLYIY